jgi:phosphatidylglycerol:prolipoprotein diacylglycerol transferase
MEPELDLFGLTIYTFGLMFGVAFIAAGWIATRRLAELGRPVDWSYEMVFSALLGGIVGAKLWWLVEEWDSARDDLLASLFSGVGLVWYGGLVGGALAVVVWARWRRAPGLMVADIAAPALALGYAVGRIGCQLAGDGDYGVPSDVPWAMAYPEGTVPTTEEVHPTPVYETLAMGAVAALLWRLRDSLPAGGLFALYLVLGGVERFLVEFVRRNEAVALGLSLAQLVSLAMIVGGLLWLSRLRGRPVGRVVSTPAGAGARPARASR